ncbi:unnamed protein product [Gongylonema pulchrum]|uniref:Ovate family protein n=1 Tax=Gongylonema pulchrum TaxID=637853 RepID=A0A183D4U6_9BILA|nr:unnamed protein product [Gongylonema pulchrum]
MKKIDDKSTPTKSVQSSSTEAEYTIEKEDIKYAQKVHRDEVLFKGHSFFLLHEGSNSLEIIFRVSAHYRTKKLVSEEKPRKRSSSAARARGAVLGDEANAHKQRICRRAIHLLFTEVTEKLAAIPRCYARVIAWKF